MKNSISKDVALCFFVAKTHEKYLYLSTSLVVLLRCLNLSCEKLASATNEQMLFDETESKTEFNKKGKQKPSANKAKESEKIALNVCQMVSK